MPQQLAIQQYFSLATNQQYLQKSAEIRGLQNSFLTHRFEGLLFPRSRQQTNRAWRKEAPPPRQSPGAGRHHRFLRLLGATAPKTGRRTAKPARKVARPREPESLRASDEKQEQDVEARSPDAVAAAVPAVSASEAAVAGKYWAHRYSLFNLYDRGVRMDAEGWYSATPESIAASQAARAAPGDLVVDAFAGCGGISIQFAARGCYVVAVEIDPRKVELAAHNARVYGVEDRIEFIVGDFFRLAPFLKADLVFLSPPWGGPSYIQAPVYTFDMLKPKDGYAIFQAAQKIAPKVMMFLPRTVDVTQVEELSWLSCPPLDFESEENYVHHRFKGITAYFGRR